MPARLVRRGKLHAGVIWRLVPRQMARSAWLACCSEHCSSSSGSASSQSRIESLSRPSHPGWLHVRPVGLNPTCKPDISVCMTQSGPAHIFHQHTFMTVRQLYRGISCSHMFQALLARWVCTLLWNCLHKERETDTVHHQQAHPIQWSCMSVWLTVCISKSLTYSLPHFGQRSAKQLP